MKNEIELEKAKIIILQSLSEELLKEVIALNNPVLKFISDSFTEEIIAKLTCDFFVHNDKEYEFSFEWYKSWWQELRFKILPSWWLNKYPSKMETKKKIKCFVAYPSLRSEDVVHKGKLQYHDIYVSKSDEED